MMKRVGKIIFTFIFMSSLLPFFVHAADVPGNWYCHQEGTSGSEYYGKMVCFEKETQCQDHAVTFPCESKEYWEDNTPSYITHDYVKGPQNMPPDPNADKSHCFHVNDISYEGTTYGTTYLCYDDQDACQQAHSNVAPKGTSCLPQENIPSWQSKKEGPSFEGYGEEPDVTVTDPGDPPPGADGEPDFYEDSDGVVQCESECGFEQFMTLLKQVVEFLLIAVAAPFAAIFFVYAGFLYMTSAGNQGQMAKAKDIFVWIIIGFAVALAAWLLVNTLIEGLGVNEVFNFLD